ncbi:MAG: imidazolonepropionase [Candidatus Marinimicrobia bacterium]|nr:imidazolonepropionase [Candidatus Neomarinimicrobiota bacterium]|tara:strand:+ start:8558 stop:9763 length:1206 start_codon:yes stop_codon:yes gene_type:complete
MLSRITNIGKIVTWSPSEKKLVSLENQEILIEDGLIAEIGEKVGSAEVEFDAECALITPGFVDSHTHPIFFGNRGSEFGMRVAGKSYEDIAKAGGGIISSINGVRNATEDELYGFCKNHIDYFLDHGTTTIEAKSGYGLTLEDELKSLRVIRRLNENSELDIVPTFMGAHDFPVEFKRDPDLYIDIICDEMIPAVTSEKLAEYCDVFCENGYFTTDQSLRILETAKKFGLKPRLHADEFKDSGAASLAAKVDAVSADHLMAVSDSGINALAKSGVIATLLPGTTFFLGKNTYADGRKMIDVGCDVAIATDFNPGSCTLQSMPMVISLATLYCGLSMEEAFVGATFNGAKSINRENEIGAIQTGYKADMLFWDIESIDEIPYWLGSDRLLSVMKNGELIEED